MEEEATPMKLHYYNETDNMVIFVFIYVEDINNPVIQRKAYITCKITNQVFQITDEQTIKRYMIKSMVRVVKK